MQNCFQLSNILLNNKNNIVLPMDSRIYFHQYRRPRHSNPTYMSSNVQHSMSFFNERNNPEYKVHTQALPRYNHQPDYHQQPSHTPIKQYRTEIEKPSSRLPEIAPRQNNSNLSNYGQRSLGLDQKAVYQRQTSPYNIISMKPKEFNDGIRQYPWYSVENRDDVYYKRMQQASYQKDYYGERAKGYEKPVLKEIAGKHTYDLQPKLSLNAQQKPSNRRFTAKMLNHMDQLQHSLA